MRGNRELGSIPALPPGTTITGATTGAASGGLVPLEEYVSERLAVLNGGLSLLSHSLLSSCICSVEF